MSEGMSTAEFTSWCREILDDLDTATEQAASDTRTRAGGTRGEALVYGVADGGLVHTLAVLGMKDDVVGSLHGLTRAHDLVLVDWCNAARYVAHADGFAV